MGLFDLEYFKLERKKDGLYRCKGGWLADLILIGGGIIYLLFRWIVSPLVSLRDRFFNYLEN